MPEFEVRATDNSTTVRVLAEDEVEAAETATPLLPEGTEAYVYRANLPVGWEGTDPEESE
ncbi:MAG: hypothetical protein M3N43_04145 [Actinomycetota bacterium]|nr:hypothetical protein [Actinomycetota bacterium]